MHYDVVKWVQDWIIHNIQNINQTKIYNTPAKRFMYNGGQQVPRILKEIYPEECRALDRKNGLAKHLIEIIIN